MIKRARTPMCFFLGFDSERFELRFSRRHFSRPIDFDFSSWRVQGSLAVSRGIGDSHLKQWVISEPETTVIEISHDCEFLILASDGLWDKVSDEEAVNLVRHLCVGIEEPKLLSACKKIAALSMARGSADDISVMIIKLSSFV